MELGMTRPRVVGGAPVSRAACVCAYSHTRSDADAPVCIVPVCIVPVLLFLD